MCRSFLRLAAALCVSVLLPCAAHAVPAYVVTPIPGIRASLPQSATGYVQMNKWGQIAGRTLSGDPAMFTPNHANGHAGQTRDLSLAPGFPAAAAGAGAAVTLNDRGEVAGLAYVGAGGGGDANNTVSWLFVPALLNSPQGALTSGISPGGVPLGKITIFPAQTDTQGTLAAYPASLDNTGRILATGSFYLPLLFTPDAGQPNLAQGSWVQLADTVSFTGRINDAGQLGGNASSLYGIDPANNGPMLVPPGGAFGPQDIIAPAPAVWDTTQAVTIIGMNQQGDLAINAVPMTDPGNVHAYLVRHGQQPVDAGLAGQLIGFAAAIDDAGTVLARLGNAATGYGAVLFASGAAHPVYPALPALWRARFMADQLQPLAMNDAGQLLFADPLTGGILLASPAARPRPQVHAVCVPGAQPTQALCHIVNGGPVGIADLSIAFDNCPGIGVAGGNPHATLFAAPAGSPVFDLPAGNNAAGPLGGATAPVPVQFTAAPAAGQCLPRPLAGPAPR